MTDEQLIDEINMKSLFDDINIMLLCPHKFGWKYSLEQSEGEDTVRTIRTCRKCDYREFIWEGR